MDAGSRLRSRPRVYGTMQNEHALSHPRMMVTNAACAPSLRTGMMSAYVSSTLSCTFIAFSPVPLTALMRLGRSRYASGPATRSASWSASSSCVLRRSAMQPSTPTTGFSFFFLRLRRLLKYARRCQIFASAFSRMAQVFTRITSASCMSSVLSHPLSLSTESITSLSLTFIWHPYVSTYTCLRAVGVAAAPGLGRSSTAPATPTGLLELSLAVGSRCTPPPGP
mmetsp:Transcript_8717/g.21958  ORF Transcript_8717/g.21958 Transcript_8717/m.21958 type:complete len:224 (-) Transcript_8717:308-979(-)